MVQKIIGCLSRIAPFKNKWGYAGLEHLLSTESKGEFMKT